MSREWHKNFIEYTKFISNHPNYNGLYIDKSADRVKWVVAGKSDNGMKRRKWWDKKCKEYSIEIKAGCYAIVALRVHPTKKHVCQICGKISYRMGRSLCDGPCATAYHRYGMRRFRNKNT